MSEPRSVRVRAAGKVNLALRVGPPRADGFHPLATVFQAVSVVDEVVVTASDEPGYRVSVTGEQADLVPTDASNLVVKAAELLTAEYGLGRRGASIDIRKAIPVTGGMAGGSADCAAALLALSVLWDVDVDPGDLAALGARLGSDVPFALLGQTALGRGRGEELASILARGRFHWVLALADFELSTPAVFRRFDELNPDADPNLEIPTGLLAALAAGDAAALASNLVNDLAPAALSLRPELRRTMDAGLTAGALAAMVSGSGPTIAFLAASEEAAMDLAVAVANAGVARVVKRVHGPVPGAKVVA